MNSNNTLETKLKTYELPLIGFYPLVACESVAKSIISKFDPEEKVPEPQCHPLENSEPLARPYSLWTSMYSADNKPDPETHGRLSPDHIPLDELLEEVAHYEEFSPLKYMPTLNPVVIHPEFMELNVVNPGRKFTLQKQFDEIKNKPLELIKPFTDKTLLAKERDITFLLALNCDLTSFDLDTLLVEFDDFVRLQCFINALFLRKAIFFLIEFTHMSVIGHLYHPSFYQYGIPRIYLYDAIEVIETFCHEHFPLFFGTKWAKYLLRKGRQNLMYRSSPLEALTKAVSNLKVLSEVKSVNGFNFYFAQYIEFIYMFSKHAVNDPELSNNNDLKTMRSEAKD